MCQLLRVNLSEVAPYTQTLYCISPHTHSLSLLQTYTIISIFTSILFALVVGYKKDAKIETRTSKKKFPLSTFDSNPICGYNVSLNFQKLVISIDSMALSRKKKE